MNCLNNTTFTRNSSKSQITKSAKITMDAKTIDNLAAVDSDYLAAVDSEQLHFNIEFFFLYVYSIYNNTNTNWQTTSTGTWHRG